MSQIHAPKRAQSRDFYPETALNTRRARSEPHLSSGANSNLKAASRLRRDSDSFHGVRVTLDELGDH